MITFEEAKAIALEYDSDFDFYTEYENAYTFFATVDLNKFGPAPLIIMKDNGEKCLMHASHRDLGDELGPARLFTGEVLDFLSEESD